MLNMVLKEVSEVKWLVMYKCGAGVGDGSKHPPHPRNTQLDLSSRNSNGSKRITVQMNSHKCTLSLTVFLYLSSTSALISFKPS